MTTENDIRELFAPLQDCAPPRVEAGLFAEADRRRRRTRRAKPIAATLAVTSALGVAMAAAPGGDVRDAARPRPTAGAVLQSAAALAAERPPLAETDGYRYERRRARHTTRFSEGGRDATVTTERIVEHWENTELDGRQVQHAGRIVAESGDPALREQLRKEFAHVFETATMSAAVANGGLGPLPKLERLPDDPERMRAALEHHIRTASSWRPGALTDGMLRSQLVGHARRLLTTAAASPSLRAKTFAMLSRLPGVTALGPRATAAGRTGQAVSVDMPGDDRFLSPGRAVFVFDDATTELVESWTASGPSPRRGNGPEATHTHRTVVEASGQVAEVGSRP